jgi:hypothetical protein
MNGQYSVGDRFEEIAKRQPDLDRLIFSNVAVVVYKLPMMVRVYSHGVLWEEFPMTARSGKRWAKPMEGEGQIPEGVYHVEALNPNSSHHLIARVLSERYLYTWHERVHRRPGHRTGLLRGGEIRIRTRPHHLSAAIRIR